MTSQTAITLYGNVGGDPETRTIPGKQVTKQFYDPIIDDMVEREQRIGLSGTTGLAGGDHLHFTMLVNGQMVNPVEWWDSHWIEDRILRKLKPGS